MAAVLLLMACLAFLRGKGAISNHPNWRIREGIVSLWPFRVRRRLTLRRCRCRLSAMVTYYSLATYG